MNSLINKEVIINTYKGNMIHKGKVIAHDDNVIKIKKDNGDILKFLVGLDEIEEYKPTLEEKFLQALEENGLQYDDAYTNDNETLYIFEGSTGCNYDVWVNIVNNEYFELSTINKTRQYYIEKDENVDYDDQTNKTTRKTIKAAINYINKYYF